MTQPAAVFRPTIHPINEAATAGPWQLVVQRVELGDAARSTMLAANERNGEAERDLQWAIAWVSATNTSNAPATINVNDFAACGAEGVLYRTPICDGPNPLLQGTVPPGETLEGALPFQIGDLSNVLLWFNSPFLGGNWADAWFALTDGAVIPEYGPMPAPSDLGVSPSSPAEFGETVRAGDFDVTITRYTRGQELFDISPVGTRALGPWGLDTWHGFLVTVRNVSSLPRFFSFVALRIADTNGDPWDHLLAFTPPEPDSAVELLPGATHEGWVSIQTREWARLDLIRVQIASISGAARYYTFGGATPKTPDPVTDLVVGDVVSITTPALNLRKEPGTTADIVQELNATDTLTITGESVEADGYLWYPVTVEGTNKQGFVVSNYLEKATDD